METLDHTHRSPVIAAFSPDTGAREPVEFGVAASRVTGAPLVVVVVVDTGSLHVHFGADEAPTLPGSIAESVRHLEHDLERRGIVAEIRPFEDSTAARGLARAIDECSPELVVVGSTSRAPRGAMLLGTTAERVIHVSESPVAVVPNGYVRPDGGVATIGVALPTQPESDEVLRVAGSLARTGGAKLRVLTVIDPRHAQEEAHGLLAEQHHEVGTEAQTAARMRFTIEANARARLTELAGGVDAEIDVMIDEPVRALVAASAHLDLLVMGSRGLGPRRAVVLGSVSRRVVDRAACPVIVIPRGSEAKAEELLADADAHAPSAT
ncbi:universal stress protein [Solirubrobacter phytolaccae]|uniref:Universal stress protein n=1 Tax=Solirubrobacter phytolaccae TaxID=1404360 RepID=A0A9X3N8D5_9ACTN|nr:universal stress protein [Solirubrobacter phytolaccae]MDA0181366.1 universal stress protein [Solirubrobacter phytolaccae]